MYKMNKNSNTGKLNEKKYILEGNIESSPVPEILTVTNVNNRRRNLQTDKMKLIILKFHIFYTYFTIKKNPRSQ